MVIRKTACAIGPKDLPIIARTAGRLAGRAIGYVQLARGQFETVMQQSQARQVLPSSPFSVDFYMCRKWIEIHTKEEDNGN